MKKLLVCHAEGVGNCIEMVPCLRTLKEVLHYDLDYWHAFSSFPIPKLIPYVDKWIRAGEIMNVNPKDYVGMVGTTWIKDYIGRYPLNELKLLNEITPLRMDRSEVDIYMDIARDLGVCEKDIIWDAVCDYSPSRTKYDVVVHNGYDHMGSANWKIKSYPYYPQVVRLLKDSGFTVCSIGSKDEYIEGADDKTGLDLLHTGGVLKNCKLFIGNDSGMYHYANALKVRNIVIFTATSIEKNYDKRFHSYSTIVCRTDLQCRPCQANRRWNKDCKTWDCREIDPIDIVKKVKTIL